MSNSHVETDRADGWVMGEEDEHDISKTVSVLIDMQNKYLFLRKTTNNIPKTKKTCRLNHFKALLYL